MNNLLLLARLPVLQGLIGRGLVCWSRTRITLVLLFLVRFVVSDRVIFASGRQDTRPRTRSACWSTWPPRTPAGPMARPPQAVAVPDVPL